MRAWLERTKLTQYQAAEDIGISQEEMSYYINGHRRPVLEKAVKIERVTGIPASAWVSSPRDKSRGTALSDSRNSAA